MRSFVSLCILCICSSFSLSANIVCTDKESCAPAVLSTETSSAGDLDELSLSVGYFFAQQLQATGCGFNAQKVMEGIQLAIEGKSSPLSEQQLEEKLAVFQELVFQKTAETNMARANAFLEENSKKEGVVSIDNKLQFMVLHTGTQGSKVVQKEDAPLVHYKGTLLDGSVFGSSYDPDLPLNLSLNDVIPGFARAVVGMQEGEKRRIFIHPDLGYGLSDQLPPNSLLIFEVEVLEASKKS